MDMTYQFWKSNLTIRSAHPVDSGAYQCIVKDDNISTSATYHVKVLGGFQLYTLLYFRLHATCCRAKSDFSEYN